VVGRYSSSYFVGTAKPLSAIEGQCEGKRLAQIVGICGRKGWLVGHAGTVVHLRERIKNICTDRGQAGALPCTLGLAVHYAS
jgi:hypothetical protein